MIDPKKIAAKLPVKARQGLVLALKNSDAWGARYYNVHSDFGVRVDHDLVYPGIRMSQLVAGGFLSSLGYAVAKAIQSSRGADL